MVHKLRIFLAAIVLSSCANRTIRLNQNHDIIPKQNEKVEEALVDLDGKKSQEQPQTKDELSETIRIGIPHEINDKVDKWITYFTGKGRERFQRYINRGEQYRGLITQVLTERGLPPDLYYLAMIESGFSTSAKSRASAVGVWQFIAPTARRYGLRVDYYADERQDPMRSTIAAAMYLRDLHNVFNSWYLAMAAYNSGENRVMSSIMRNDSRDFWALVRSKALPSETMNYIPKFLAASIIGHSPEKYGFSRATPVADQNFRTVEIPSPVKFSDISRITGISVQNLKKYNPGLKRSMTPPGAKTYRIVVPEVYVNQIADNTAAIQRHVISGLKNRVNSGSEVAVHRVTKGQSLSYIAQKYKTSISSIKKLNRLRSNNIYVGQKLKVHASVPTSTEKYRVRSGDSLFSIARKFKTSTNQIKSLNNLRSNTIHAGQLLTVNGNGTTTKQSKYRVKKGDNLHLIAKKFGTSINKIKKLNRLRRNTIYAGQLLKVSTRNL